jgi:hypothetical protein
VLFRSIGGGNVNLNKSVSGFIGGGSLNINANATIFGSSSVNANCFILSGDQTAFFTNGDCFIASSYAGAGICNSYCGVINNVVYGGGYTTLETSSYFSSGQYPRLVNTTTATDGCNFSTIGGGFSNKVLGCFSKIGGGYCNTASYCATTVGGGRQNTASCNYATVGGGYCNIASNYNATVGGGQVNTASKTFSTIGGGNVNLNKSVSGFIGGGSLNLNANATIFSPSSVNANCFILYGDQTASFTNGDCFIGANNIGAYACNSYSGVINNVVYGGGYTTLETSSYFTSGYYPKLVNTTTATDGCNFSTIGGGFANKVFGCYATIGGGFCNTASSNSSFVGGGANNTASASLSFVGGGKGNCASGIGATISGGSSYTVYNSIQEYYDYKEKYTFTKQNHYNFCNVNASPCL